VVRGADVTGVKTFMFICWTRSPLHMPRHTCERCDRTSSVAAPPPPEGESEEGIQVKDLYCVPDRHGIHV
jgi:hypothetical protein